MEIRPNSKRTFLSWDQLKDEMIKYQAQMAEAEEMLGKI
jgi:hypothetical protein